MNAAVQFDALPQRAETQRGLTAVAMSGGVDSSAVAALLQQQGRPVVGLTMQLWNQRRLPELQGDGPAQHRCCSLDDVYDAKRVAQHLNFPHYVVNFEEQFEARVVRPFVEQYLSGRTPIACTNGNYVQFIQAYSRAEGIAVNNQEGDIVTEDGSVIGRHAGIHNYTVGQRKGLGFAAGKPVYVVSIDTQNNRIIVGEDEALRTSTLEIESVNWISVAEPTAPILGQAKIRHKHDPASATIEALPNNPARITFEAPHRPITPGQAPLFYNNQPSLPAPCITTS